MTVHPRPARRIEINAAAMSQARAALSLSYPQLAARLTEQGHPVSHVRLWQIEHGKGSPSPALFPALARALGLAEHELRRAA